MDREWDDRFETVIRDSVPALPADATLTAEHDLTAFGLSSLGIVQLLMRLEAAYGVQLADDLLDFRLFTNVGRLWSALAATLPGTAAAAEPA
ncbi:MULTISPECIES: phosphopantetheine-binding protein [Kitasatospora]|uniref:phosphopantetheine-binding protein n=1 Tax=Kitasatospora TaxID=2063 RepID=UPI000CB6627B|nr:phosphopantetheine-binding protein [Kitasatospora sp. GP30]MDH6139333.1 acyl carrier protein [Kitasatospora sp. GP30]